jgi:SAM-dependent methyltransferase
MGDKDVPSPIDFHDLAQARAWEADTIARRPWRPDFFAAFARELNGYFSRPFSVLEIGSGPGHLAGVITTQCSVSEYCALDFSEAMHSIARERIGRSAAPIRFVARDFRQPNWSSGLGPFDVVVTMQAAHEIRHRRHLPKLLLQVRNALVPGGIFLYCDHYAEGGQNPDLVLPRAEQPIVLGDAGFSNVRRLLDLGGMALYAGKRPS